MGLHQVSVALISSCSLAKYPSIMRFVPHLSLVCYAIAACFLFANFADAKNNVVFQEQDGIVAVEAEHFFEQAQTDRRAFYLTTSTVTPGVKPDPDPTHLAGASGGAYLEILPDTRVTHDDELIEGTNFSPDPGKMAVVHYRVNFQTPGKYYVWARAYSGGGEDNGLHVGLDGEWPESGQRLQWCVGKNGWRWESKQRTKDVHCGVPHMIFLNVKTAGQHTVSFSMREDGFEFDKWLMTTNRDFARPADAGPVSVVHSGTMPAAYPAVAAAAPQAKRRSKPGASKGVKVANGRNTLTIGARDFDLAGTGFYLDQGKWLAINPEQRKQAKVTIAFPYPTGKYDVTLQAIGESDGQSTYKVELDDELVGNFKCPLSKEMFEDAPKFRTTWKAVAITDGSILKVTANIGSSDGLEYARARWVAVKFHPADEATRNAAQPFLERQKPKSGKAALPSTSSTTKPVGQPRLVLPRQPDGDGSIKITGETKQWHKVTLTMDGPFAHEQDNSPNPYTDRCMSVTWKHTDGTTYTIPGFFAADGNAGESSAESGTAWRAHFTPDRIGQWSYQVSFKRGPLAALSLGKSGDAVTPFDGQQGQVSIAISDKQGNDLRAHGRLQLVGKRYQQFAGSKRYFLKAGADAPETLLGYVDFDNTIAGKPKKVPLKTWTPHIGDWQSGEPTWKKGKGKGLIGAINYLSGKGCNAFSFLTYNAGGDGDNVWPFTHRDDKLHYDCSKLDQWGIVFDHGTAKGMYLHFKLQETENDDDVPESLDGGDLGVQRKLYCREMIARFAHNLALNWNISEENTQSTKQIKAMLDYIASLDAYGHNRVTHTYPNQQDKVYRPLLGNRSKLTGVSLQNSTIKATHRQTVKWVQLSQASGKPWIVAFDESGTAAHGQSPDLGYRGFDGHDKTGKMAYTQHEVRKQTLWGTLMGGGAGVEYYFGYQFEENDLICEDWRSRDQSWDYCRIAINFFHDNEIPFWEMSNQDALVGNPKHGKSRFCFAKSDEVYVVYLADGGTTELDLSGTTGNYTVQWFNPRDGGAMQSGTVPNVQGGDVVDLGKAPEDTNQDWVVLVKQR